MLGPTQMVSWGILYYGFGVMLPHIRAEMSWSAAEASGAFSIALLTGGLAALPVGRWLDRHGPRGLMTAGSCAAVMLLIALANVQSLPMFYLVWSGIGLATAAVLYEPAFWVVAHWFTRCRARALTVVTFWAGLASTVFIPLISLLVQRLDWRNTLLLMAGVLAVCTVMPHALLLRKNPAALGLSVDGDEALVSSNIDPANQPSMTGRQLELGLALRTRNFWLLALAFSLTTLVSTAMGTYFISSQLARGMDVSMTAAAAGAVGIMQAVGRLILVPISGRLPRSIMTALVCGLQALGLMGLVSLPVTASVIAYIVLYGLGLGALTPMRASLVAELFGVRAYGSINGSISLASTFSRGVAPIGMGMLITMHGDYSPSLLLLTGAAICATLSVLFLEKR